MKKNYKTMIRRDNRIKDALLGFFLAFCSWPRLLLEVMIRRNFGERYFTFSGSVVLAFLLAMYPILKANGVHLFSYYSRFHHGFDMGEFIGHYFMWYVYLATFLYMAIQRQNEIRNLPSVFNFARYSLSTGLIHPKFYEIRFNGKQPDTRTIETLLEPGFFFIAGLLLWGLGQSLGPLLVLSSVFYALSYVAAYHEGDNFVMDKIDEMIINEEMVKAFVEGRDASETRGFRFVGHRPADPEFRRQLADTFMADDEETVEAM